MGTAAGLKVLFGQAVQPVAHPTCLPGPHMHWGFDEKFASQDPAAHTHDDWSREGCMKCGQLAQLHPAGL